MSNVEAIKKALEGVTQDEAIGFIKTAMRNWSHVPVLDADDLRDLAEELQRFSERRYAYTLESLQSENEGLKKDRDRTARNRDMYRGQVERQSAQITMFREEETRLRETLFKCGSFIADRYQEGDAEYQVVLLVNDAICRNPALACTGGEHHAE